MVFCQNFEAKQLALEYISKEVLLLRPRHCQLGKLLINDVSNPSLLSKPAFMKGHKMYFVAACGNQPLTVEGADSFYASFRNLDWQSFDEYSSARNSIWVVIMKRHRVGKSQMLLSNLAEGVHL